MKNVHIIVATGEWGQDNLRYRRHRLAEYLQKQPETKEVIWLCPAPHQTEASFSVLPNGIKQWPVQDLLPQKVFRFGRYVDRFYKKKIERFLSYLKQFQEQYKLILWYTFPGFPMLADLFNWDRVIYDCSDLWASPISGSQNVLSTFREKVISSAEDRIVKKAETIFCTSDYLRDRIVAKLGSSNAGHVHTFENGVEFDLFAAQVQKVDGVLPADFAGTVLGFIGGIKPKLDLALIKKAARQKRDWLFLFVGPDGTGMNHEFQQLLNEPNVLWTGSVPPLEVPQYMNLIDIGVMPYKPSPYNQAVFPLKLFEFLAAGKPAVGVHLPSTKKYAEHAVYAHIETTGADDFIRACEELQYEENHQDRRRRLAKTKDWDDLFRAMVEIVIVKNEAECINKRLTPR